MPELSIPPLPTTADAGHGSAALTTLSAVSSMQALALSSNNNRESENNDNDSDNGVPCDSLPEAFFIGTPRKITSAAESAVCDMVNSDGQLSPSPCLESYFIGTPRPESVPMASLLETSIGRDDFASLPTTLSGNQSIGLASAPLHAFSCKPLICLQ